MMKNIDCIFYDFDGVMTDNRVLVTEDGREAAMVNRSDGLAVARIKSMGINQIIVSTETNPIVEHRSQKLGIEVVHGINDKAEAIKQICSANGYDLSRVAFIGNDLNDLSAISIVGIRGCPSDAYEVIKRKCNWVSKCKGGYGVIRDLYDWLIEEGWLILA